MSHFSNPFWGPGQKFFFGGCSQRLTLKDFTIGCCIRDILLHMSYANNHGELEMAPTGAFSWLKAAAAAPARSENLAAAALLRSSNLDIDKILI